MNADQAVRFLAAQGDKAEAQAIQAVIKAYGHVSLADMLAMVQVGLDRTTPRLRLAQLDSLMAQFDAATAGLSLPPDQVLGQLEGVITANVTAASQMLAAGELVDAFRVPPKLQLEWTELAAERLKLYWTAESSQFRNEVQSALIDGLTRGQGVDQVAKRIKDRLGVSRSRATLIARNELGNAAGYAMQESQRLGGVTQYIWRATKDSRTRPEHKARDGKTFNWDDLPWDGHPGQAINCRCVALPVLE